MNQTATAFDKHRLLEQLIEAEMPKKQAEIFASTLLDFQVATKSDIEGVKGELLTQINGVKNDSAGAKADNTNLKTQMNGKFEAVDGRFEAVDGKFEGLNHQFEGVNNRIEGVNHRLEGVNHKIDALRTETKSDNANLKAYMDGRFEAVDAKIEALRTELKADAANREARMDTNLAKLENRLFWRLLLSMIGIVGLAFTAQQLIG